MHVLGWLDVKTGVVAREIPFDFAQGGLSPRWREREASE